MSEAASAASSELNGKSERYIDAGPDETEQPVSHPGIKLSPNDHARFYDDVRGQSEARGVPEEPEDECPLPRRVRRLLAHPGERDYDGLLQ
jgi:hypothetical protein